MIRHVRRAAGFTTATEFQNQEVPDDFNFQFNTSVKRKQIFVDSPDTQSSR